MAVTAPERGTDAGLRATLGRLGERLGRWETPATSYYLLLGAVLTLVVFGLVMVLSSSSVTSIADSGSPFSVFSRQAVFAGIGLPLMWVLSRVRIEVWKRLAWPALVGALCAQLLVFTPLGVRVNGNLNWIEVAGFRGQPSELVKVALVLWCGVVLARKGPLLAQWQHVVVPVGIVAAGALGLVLLGHDLGTALVLMLVVAVMLFVSGVRLRMFVLAGAAAAAVITMLVLSSANRVERVGIWLSGECTDRYGTCLQPIHGEWALASGGWWGVGLGASREKWSWLPEAHNDFIYAIIGEELGLPGTLAVLGLLAVVCVAGLRVVQRHDDPFVKIATAGVIAWVVGQGLINVGVVLGLLPVVGVPLPLVSSGGSALITTLMGLGMVLSFARQEPGADDALAARAGVVRRSLAVVGSRGSAGRGSDARGRR
jgi:cell division protein FtsW